MATVLFTAIVGSTSTANAQLTTPFLRTSGSETFVPLTGGTALVFGNNDNATSLAPIGFTFTYYDEAYDYVNVSTNGALHLARPCQSVGDCPGLTPRCAAVGACQLAVPPDAPQSTPALPDATEPNAIVAAVWDDLIVAPGQVVYATVGTAPNRELVVEWRTVQHAPSTMSDATFQIRLAESGRVRLHYGAFDLVAAEAASWSAAAGVEDDLGTTGEIAFGCAASAACNGNDLDNLENTYVEWQAPVGPELIPRGRAPTGGPPAATIDVVVTADNFGTVGTGVAVPIDIRLSTDNTIDTNDPLLGSVTLPAIASLASATATVTVTLPSLPAGLYRLAAIADPANAVAEAIETNNTVVLERNFLLGEDLSAQIATPPPADAGGPVELVVNVANRGSPQAAVGLSVAYSRDTTLDAMDVVVVTTTVAVPQSPSFEVRLPIVLPTLARGDYWAIVSIDPGQQIAEFDETNNVGVSDLQTLVRGPDLVAAGIGTPAAFALRGAPLMVTGRIENAGEATASGFFYDFYLSENALCSVTSDPLLGSFGPVDLDAGQALDVQHTGTVPLTLPATPHFLCLVVDPTNAVVEERTTNNVRRTNMPIDVRDRQPDLTVTDVRPARRAAGAESFRVARVLINQGNRMAQFDYAAYLSTDPELDTNDVPLGQLTTTLDGATTDIGADTWRVPAGTPPGPYYVVYELDPAGVVDELLETNNTATSTSTVYVEAPTLAIDGDTLPDATVGVPYRASLTASGGTRQVLFTATGLPPGLELVGRQITGLPELDGLFQVEVTATDGGAVAVATMSLLVLSASTPLEIVTRGLPPAFLDRPYEFPVAALGGQWPYTWTITAGRLPTGLTLDEDRITGTATLREVEEIELTVIDARGDSASQRIVVRVIDPSAGVRFAADLLPDGVLGEPYDVSLSVQPGGTAPFVYAVVSGELPEGLTLDTDGRISGTPLVVGVYSFGVRVADANEDFDLNRFVVEITTGDDLVFTTTSLPEGRPGETYEGRIEANSPSPAIRFEVIRGALPNMVVVTAGGNVTGTPDEAGVFSFVVRATDNSGRSAIRAFGIVIREPVEPPVDDEGGCGCTSSSRGAGGAPLLLLLLLAGVVRTRRRWLLLLFVLAPATASAQADYVVRTTAATYTPFVGTALTFSPDDDNGEANLPLPFAFDFFGRAVTHVRVGTNGVVVMDNAPAFYDLNAAIPSSATPNGIIAPWWDDLVDVTATTIVEGTAPRRRVAVQFTGDRAMAAAAGTVQWQLRLFEGPGGRFEVRYAAPTGVVDANAWDASSGFEDDTGVVGAALIGCPSPTCNGTDLIGAGNRVVSVQRDLGADLVVEAVSSAPRVVIGVPTEVEVTYTSRSAQDLGPVTLDIGLQNGGPVASFPLGVIPSFGVVTRRFEVTLPMTSTTGIDRFVATIDAGDAVAEPDEANNTATGGPVEVLPEAPDFTVVSVDSNPGRVSPGGTVMLEVSVGNLGTARDYPARFVLSRNTVIGTDDRTLAEGTIPAAVGVPPPSPPRTEAITIPADVPPGTYHLGVILDPDDEHAELDELNNTGFGPPFVVFDTLAVVASAPDAAVGAQYAHRLRATGGDGSYTWRVSGLQLPDGLTLDATGLISGRPTTAGAAMFDVTVASDGMEASAVIAFEVLMPVDRLTIVTRNLRPGIVGQPYEDMFVVVGGRGEITFDANMPAGLELDRSGLVTGLPTIPGDFTIAVSASDATNSTSRSVFVTIAEPGRLTVVADALPPARVGTPYETTLNVLGATGTVAFSSTDLFDEFTLSTDGRLTGTPTDVGVHAFTVVATDDSATDSATFRLEVGANGELALGPDALPPARVGLPYEVQLRTDVSGATWEIDGDLPEGLTTEPGDNLTIRGTATRVETRAFLVTVSVDDGRQTSGAFTIDVVAPTTGPDEGCGCTSTSGTGGRSAWWLVVLLALRRRRHQGSGSPLA